MIVFNQKCLGDRPRRPENRDECAAITAVRADWAVAVGAPDASFLRLIVTLDMKYYSSYLIRMFTSQGNIGIVVIVFNQQQFTKSGLFTSLRNSHFAMSS